MEGMSQHRHDDGPPRMTTGSTGRPTQSVIKLMNEMTVALSQPLCRPQPLQRTEARCGPFPGPMTPSTLPQAGQGGRITVSPMGDVDRAVLGNSASCGFGLIGSAPVAA